jgi:hypothetical protein
MMNCGMFHFQARPVVHSPSSKHTVVCTVVHKRVLDPVRSSANEGDAATMSSKATDSVVIRLSMFISPCR